MAAYRDVSDGAGSRGKIIKWPGLYSGRAALTVIAIHDETIAASEQDVRWQARQLLDIDFGLSAPDV